MAWTGVSKNTLMVLYYCRLKVYMSDSKSFTL